MALSQLRNAIWTNMMIEGSPGQQQIIIRDATTADIGSIVTIEAELQVLPWSEQTFLDSYNSENTVFLLAEDAEKAEVIAFIIYLKLNDTIEILNLAVKKDRQGNGIGKKIFMYALDLASKSSVLNVQLEVRRGNTPAIKIYQSAGMKIVGIRKGYYRDNHEDALLLSGKVS